MLDGKKHVRHLDRIRECITKSAKWFDFNRLVFVLRKEKGLSLSFSYF
jgi:hypothetical protein